MASLTSEQKKAMIRALLREREGYARYGHKDRIAEVDEQLRLLGHDAKPPQKRATQMTRKPAESTQA